LYCTRNRCFYFSGDSSRQELHLVEPPAHKRRAAQRHWHDGIEVLLAIEDAEHQLRGQSFDEPRVAPVLEGVDFLIADARVLRWGAGALETEVNGLAPFADEGLEGRWHPAPGAEGASYPGQCIEAHPAEQIARALVAADAALGVEEVDEGRDVWF
jgi:hypothetical protein